MQAAQKVRKSFHNFDQIFTAMQAAQKVDAGAGGLEIYIYRHVGGLEMSI